MAVKLTGTDDDDDDDDDDDNAPCRRVPISQTLNRRLRHAITPFSQSSVHFMHVHVHLAYRPIDHRP